MVLDLLLFWTSLVSVECLETIVGVKWSGWESWGSLFLFFFFLFFFQVIVHCVWCHFGKEVSRTPPPRALSQCVDPRCWHWEKSDYLELQKFSKWKKSQMDWTSLSISKSLPKMLASRDFVSNWLMVRKCFLPKFCGPSLWFTFWMSKIFRSRLHFWDVLHHIWGGNMFHFCSGVCSPQICPDIPNVWYTGSLGHWKVFDC